MPDVKEKTKKDERYIEAVGRRKTSIARVRITPASKASAVVNDLPISEYFATETLVKTAQDPLVKSGLTEKFKITVLLSGGGTRSQAEALRHGLTRALVSYSPELRKTLKKFGFLKRDPRMKERRKFGLKKARKAPQWSKR